MSLRFVLIHSPLVGPSTWSPLADQLRALKIAAVVPSLVDEERDQRPYWQQHARSVAHELAAIPADQPLMLVGHSGAGPLLPAIRQLLPQPIAGYIFVDAGLPLAGAVGLICWQPSRQPLQLSCGSTLKQEQAFPPGPTPTCIASFLTPIIVANCSPNCGRAACPFSPSQSRSL